MKRVCFVTDECNGVSSAGGIGACVRGLAQWLAANGDSVDILMTNLHESSENLEPGAGGFVNNVFFLSDVAKLDKAIYAPVDETSKSYHIYRFLSGRDYDEVHFNDYRGSGFYTAMARRQGLFGAAVITHLHGSWRWVRLHNLDAPELRDLETEGLENSQIENSDLLISPSNYLIDWYREQGLTLPKAIQRAWVLPQWSDPAYVAKEGPLRTRAVAPGEIEEIVFFGRHERRKGFDVFVDAIARLPENLTPDITFVGRFDRFQREHTGGYVLRTLRNYPGRLRFLSDYQQVEALNLLRRSRRALAVMPSRIENSPCVVGECFTIGVPFLASDVGGTAELVAPESRASCLAAPTAAALSTAIRRAMEEGMPELVSTLSPRSIRESWLAPITVEPAPKSDAKPLVSVCLVHYERPQLLRRAFEALIAQTYENIEIVIADDGSRSEGAHAYLNELETTPARFPVKILRGPNRYLGAARNAAARAAGGEYLLFHDDDNFAEPNEVEVFVAAALASDADVLTCQCYVFRDGVMEKEGLKRRIEFYHLGIGGDFSFFDNRFGDANALVRRSVFEEMAGFSEDYGVGFEDWEFFLKAYVAGRKLGIVPLPLFNYRASTTGMLSSGNVLMDHERIFRVMDAQRPRLGSDVIRLMTRNKLSQLVLDRKWVQLGRERGSEILHQLTSVVPNSSEAIYRLSELALEYGRLADAVELGSRNYEAREKLAALLHDPHVKKRFRKPFDILTLEPTDAHHVAFVEGWSIDGSGKGLDPEAIWAAGRWLPVAHIRREPRRDVMEAFRLPSDGGLGFSLFAFEASETTSKGRGWIGGWLGAAGRKVEDAKPMHRKAFQGEDFESNLPAGPGWRGHIDRGAWYRTVKLTLPESYEASPIVEIETSAPAAPAIIWGDGVFDWEGTKPSATRVRFARSTGAGGPEVTIIVPSRMRVHIVLG